MIEKKTESVKVDMTTLELLRDLKEKEGINMSTAITLAVKEKYGDRLYENNKFENNKSENKMNKNKIIIKENFDN